MVGPARTNSAPSRHSDSLQVAFPLREGREGRNARSIECESLWISSFPPLLFSSQRDNPPYHASWVILVILIMHEACGSVHRSHCLDIGVLPSIEHPFFFFRFSSGFSSRAYRLRLTTRHNHDWQVHVIRARFANGSSQDSRITASRFLRNEETLSPPWWGHPALHHRFRSNSASPSSVALIAPGLRLGPLGRNRHFLRRFFTSASLASSRLIDLGGWFDTSFECSAACVVPI